MNCKFCGAEMEEGSTLCPVCGKENAEVAEISEQQTEFVCEEQPTETPEEQPQSAPKHISQIWKIVAAVCGGLVLLGVLAFVVLRSMGFTFTMQKPGAETTAPTASVPQESQPESFYTATDPEKTAGKVVVEIGDAQITNGQLQIYYWADVVEFLNYYGSYAIAIGLDYTQPFGQQACALEDGITWEEYFLEDALRLYEHYQYLALLAREEGVELEPDIVEALAKVPENLEAGAADNGYESATAYLEASFGAGVTVEDYVNYLTLNYLAVTYYGQIHESYDPTPAQIREYFLENEELFAQDGITMDSGNWVDVRHILVQIEGGTKDEDGNMVYSDEEWETCREKAQALYDRWLAGEATEDSFAALANEASEDPGSNTNGGLYTQVLNGRMVPGFNDWIFDESRAPGDHGLVQTRFGYHIIYFVSSEEAWSSAARSGWIDEAASQKVQELVADAEARWPAKVTYEDIAIGALNLASAS